MRENKGFTLVEMLGVLIILIVVFMIMFPSLTKIIKDTNDKIDNATITVIEDATTDFLLEKNDIYPKNDDYTYCITIEQLIDNGNLTNKEISSLDDTDKFVKTTFENGKSVYVLTDTCTVSKPNIEFALIGNNNMSFEVGVGGQYVEPGANAKNKAGEVVSYVTEIINKNKVTVAYVDTTKIGVYTVKYIATIDGKDYAIERIVKVIDTTSPTITVNPTTETISVTNKTYNVLSGVTSSDNSGVSPKITASTNLSLGQTGNYTITYTAIDSSGNKTTAKRTVIISSGSLVSISIGVTSVTHEINSGVYVDPAVNAQDISGNDLTLQIVKTIRKNGNIVSSVDVDKIEKYYITYSITRENVTYSETRTVNIVDTTKPVITGAGDTNIYVTDNTYNVMAGVSVTDNSGEIITINTVSNLTLGIVGSYSVTYTATDSSGNTATVIRIINVLDNILPTIAFSRNGTGEYFKNSSTIVTVSDNVAVNASSLKYLWSTSTSTPSESSFVTSFSNGGTINTPTEVTGIYYLWVLGKDSSGNMKITSSGAFYVDNTAPAITLNGSNSISIYVNTAYNELGANATDAHSGISGNIMITGTVNTSSPGVYSLTYRAIDWAGNYSAQLTRTVTVKPYTVYANGTAVYFNPVSGAKCTSGEAVSTTGTKTGCMKWFAFIDGGSTTSTINLILDHNTSASVAWNSSGYNTSGPSNVTTQLKTDTSSWAGVPTRTDNYVLSNGTASYTINYSTYKARLIKASEIATITGNAAFVETTSTSSSYFYLDSNNQTQTATTTGASRFAWLFNYTKDCTGYGCSIADASVWGYWTSTAVASNNTYAWRVSCYGRFDFDNKGVSASYSGVRPVITISKVLLD